MSAPEADPGIAGDCGREPPWQVNSAARGGIAYDFNNILGVMINYARFAAGLGAARLVRQRPTEEIRRAAEAFGLVQQ